MIVWAFAGAMLLAVVHLFAGRLKFLDAIPRSRWLSFGSGISVAYVFLHLLPELAETRERLEEQGMAVLERANNPVFLVTTLGLALFYGLERMAKESRSRQRREHGDDSTSRGVFWLHIGSFGIYNLITGYLLAEKAGMGAAEYALFLTALALHFVVNDYGLREHHKQDYHTHGRWALAAAVLLGAATRAAVSVPMIWVYLLMSFLGGGIILNVLKEELPEQRRSRFPAFALGLVIYGVLLQMV